ncbi:hypothetical protein [Congregicoccus parvus]
MIRTLSDRLILVATEDSSIPDTSADHTSERLATARLLRERRRI